MAQTQRSYLSSTGEHIIDAYTGSTTKTIPIFDSGQSTTHQTPEHCESQTGFTHPVLKTLHGGSSRGQGESSAVKDKLHSNLKLVLNRAGAAITGSYTGYVSEKIQVSDPARSPQQNVNQMY